jgi:hypothetical protein
VFTLRWIQDAQDRYEEIREAASRAIALRAGKGKSTKAEGLFNQVHKALTFLTTNPRHPGLNSHEFHSMEHPYRRDQKVWESYAQNRTPGAYRIFWCYGPDRGEITILAITPHP